ncbi:hypothetical protein HOLleu_12895 [Holothuria leucospilota]|uniref:MIF4G domain-containing protein n=1 Tax=Holothuria leucospilota TaxID=206669 RepID=A0A9Q1HAG4_HOLLE|nr:hypothetical protein HOLleu_12895 [Holothuria leucospilota]
MTQVGTKTSFGYSARKMFGKDHHMVSSSRSDIETLTEEDIGASQTEKREFTEEVTRLLKYGCILRTAKGKQFENVLGRLHWMLKTIGAELDIKYEDSMDELYETLRDLILDNTRSKSSRWKMMELLELRAHNWENADSISEYYENPANFMMGEMGDNNNVIKSPTSPPPGTNVLYHPGTIYFGPPQNVSGVSTSHIPRGDGSFSSRSRNVSGGSTPRRAASDSDHSSRSRNASGGSIGVSNYPRRASGASSRQSLVEEDVFHDAEESFTMSSSKISSDSTDDDSDESYDDVESRSPEGEAVTPAKYRLMQINSGKPIKYTRNFLLGCWASPHSKVMPSNLKHTIANSDIAYIIKGPPFENPIHLIAAQIEATTKLQGHQVRRSLSLPSESSSQIYQPPTIPVPPPMRSISVSTSISPADIAYYELPQSIYPVQTAAVPMLHTEAWRRMFKDAIRQIDSKQ